MNKSFNRINVTAVQTDSGIYSIYIHTNLPGRTIRAERQTWSLILPLPTSPLVSTSPIFADMSSCRSERGERICEQSDMVGCWRETSPRWKNCHFDLCPLMNSNCKILNFISHISCLDPHYPSPWCLWDWLDWKLINSAPEQRESGRKYVGL